MHRAVDAGHKGKPARGVSVAHQNGAEASDEGRRHHIADEMRRDDNAAKCDHCCIDQHRDACLRPKRRDGDRRREGGGGVA